MEKPIGHFGVDPIDASAEEKMMKPGIVPNGKIIICGTPHIAGLLRAKFKDIDITILTVDEATEKGIDTAGAIIHSLPPIPIEIKRITEPINFFEEKRKGHVRPYKYHR